MQTRTIRSMYRISDALDENKTRRNQRCHRDTIKPELIAEQPNQVWSWDITKQKSTCRLTYFHLYVLLDTYSRYVVGWMIAERECKKLARQLLHKSILRYGIQQDQLTVHSDNGPSMTSQYENSPSSDTCTALPNRTIIIIG